MTYSYILTEKDKEPCSSVTKFFDRHFKSLWPNGAIGQHNREISGDNGSNPIGGKGFLIWPVRLSVRTRDFHSLKSSSTLLPATTCFLQKNFVY